jgi:hypothetical protein
VSTTLASGRTTRRLDSTVPPGSPASLLATVTGDLAYLHFSARGFSAFAPGPPPSLTALLSTDLLSFVLPGNEEDREPIGLSAGESGTVISFPHGYLSLGPLFRTTIETARDTLAQSSGREPMQLSGVAPGPGDDLYLLSEREGKIAAVNPRLGTRRLIDAPGLSGLTARLLDPDTLAVLSDARGSAGITLHPLRGGKSRLLSVGGYVSAFCTDSEGNLWAWDIGERRIRVLTRGGREVFAIRPLFDASLVPIPQQLEVFDDGSFLLGGSGEVWKFESSGIPDWRLTRIPGRPTEKLPPAFALAVNRSDGSFVLLDAPSRRLLSFASGPIGAAADLAAFYGKLDARNPEDLRQGAALAGAAGLTLLRFQFDTLLAQRGGTEAPAAAARRDLVRDRARGSARLAQELERDLLFARSQAAYLRAGEAARAVLAEVPDDDEAAAILLESDTGRRAARAAAAIQPVTIVSASVHVTHPAACGAGLDVALRVRNDGTAPLSAIAVHANLPAVSSGPSQAALDRIAAGEARDVVVSLDPGPGWTGAAPGAADPAARALPLAVLVTGARGGEGFTAAFSLSVRIAESRSAVASAEASACDAEPADALLRGMPDLLLGAATEPRDPLTTLAALLDVLADMRLRAAGKATGGAALPADAAGVLPGARATVRGLDPGDTSWALLIASLGASLGLPAGVVSLRDRVFALIDTGLPLAETAASLPELGDFAPVLEALARNGSLCVPVSGDAGLATAADACADALGFCARQGMSPGAAGVSIAWLDPGTGGRTKAPVLLPFPFILPSLPPAETSPEELRQQLLQALHETRGAS